MASVFDQAVIYSVEAICETPVRTGDADGDVEQVLHYKDGTLFIQGNSISGAMRAWLENNVDKKLAAELFGNQEREGHLIISDGVFPKDATIGSRTGIKLDGSMGVVQDGGKYDVSHINAGEKMKFSITWTGKKKDKSQIEFIEKMLSAMNAGDIRLGAKKTNGFGVFKLLVRKKIYDMTDKKDRNAWLEETDPGRVISLEKLQKRTYTEFLISGKLSSVLVKAAVAEHTGEDSYTANLMEGNKAIIPGSSVKGAVRARVEAITEVMRLNPSIVTEMFGNETENSKAQNAGRIYFEDVRMDTMQKEKITRIRINKFTGGVIRGGLFREEPLSAKVKIRICVPDTPVYCMLILYALRDLGQGLYNLGSGGSIGRGYITTYSVEATDCRNKKIKLTFDENGNCHCEDGANLTAIWSQELEARR